VDKIINSHIDKLEEIERQVNAVIEQETSQIDIAALVSNPEAVLAQVADNVLSIYLDQYAHDAVELGFELGKIINKKIEQDKTIKVDDSKNPKLNVQG
jgi:hypothetical protein